MLSCIKRVGFIDFIRLRNNANLIISVTIIFQPYNLYSNQSFTLTILYADAGTLNVVFYYFEKAYTLLRCYLDR